MFGISIIFWGTQLSEPGTNEELALPKPNPFIPTDLSVDKVEVAEVRGFVGGMIDGLR